MVKANTGLLILDYIEFSVSPSYYPCKFIKVK